MSPVVALSVISLLRGDSVAFGCEADMRTVDRSNQSDVNDPTRTSPSERRLLCWHPPIGGWAAPAIAFVHSEQFRSVC